MNDIIPFWSNVRVNRRGAAALRPRQNARNYHAELVLLQDMTKLLGVFLLFLSVPTISAQDTESPEFALITLDNLNEIGGVEALSIDGAAGDIVWSPDGEILAVAAHNVSGIWLFDAEDFSAAPEFLDFPAYQIAFSPNGDYIALVTWDSIRILSAKTHKDLMTFPDYRAAAFASDSITLALAGWNTVTLVNLESGEELTTFHYPEMESCDFGCGFYDVLISPDETLLVVHAYAFPAPMWEIATEEIIAYPLFGEQGTAAFSPDGALLVSRDRWSIRFLDGHTGEFLFNLPSPGTDGGNMAFSPDGTILVAGSVDTDSPVGRVVLWDVNALLQLDPETIGSESFSGNRLAAVEGLFGHSSMVEEVAFNPDGTLIASSDIDGGSIILWGIVGE